MVTKTLEQVEQEIAETKMALNNVHGTETEVYARIVGYYRAVKHWNKGKRDEFDMRKMFSLDSSKEHDISQRQESSYAQPVNNKANYCAPETAQMDSVTYEMYTKKTCPNCPPVKDFMSKVEMDGRSIDVDTAEGLSEAAQKGVFASPTVIFYNAEGIETARCHSVDELEVVCNKVTVIA